MLLNLVETDVELNSNSLGYNYVNTVIGQSLNIEQVEIKFVRYCEDYCESD